MSIDSGPRSPAENANRYARGIMVLAAVGVVCALGIFIAEALGAPGRSIFWSLGGAALGAIFVVYGLILLLMRKMGTIGPRRAEH
jgi:hypothetical protein